ncbi:Heat shock protein STI [Dendrobium catenatum]|uniref:Heat shock protein STI n=1 Tax=Dendrobium catenatum TaxID=906689 RepID=A0A2I0VRY3_9ASPA|nr:Heat shock protein STI [Dendrobium catenatum]
MDGIEISFDDENYSSLVIQDHYFLICCLRLSPPLRRGSRRKTVEIKPNWSKGYSRLGAVHLGLVNHEEAIVAYQKGLDHDPNNEALKSGLADARAAANRSRKPSAALSMSREFISGHDRRFAS